MKNIWSKSICQKPKLRTYVLYKNVFEPEPYVAHYMSRHYRSILAQFRLGILPLHIETGRFSNTSLEDRLCTICNASSVEDEFHFLMVCPKYKYLREKLFAEVASANEDFLNKNETDKFVFLNTDCQKQLAMFLCKSWEIRQSSLYINNVNSS